MEDDKETEVDPEAYLWWKEQTVYDIQQFVKQNASRIRVEKKVNKKISNIAYCAKIKQAIKKKGKTGGR